MPEKILHLYWSCNLVNNFWNELTDFFISNNIFIPFERNKILFGLHKEPPDSLCNFIILCAKQYIWNNKFREPHTPLSLIAFLNVLKVKCIEQKNVAAMLKDFEQLDNWNTLLLII